MNRKLFKDCLFLIIYAIALVVVLLKLDVISGFFGAVLGVLTPIFMGLIIALILNVPYIYTKRFIWRRVFHKRAPRAAKVLSLVLIYLLLIAILFGVIWFVFPELTSSGEKFIANMENYYNNLTTTLSSIGEHFKMSEQDMNEYLGIFKDLFENTSKIFSDVVAGLVNVTSSIIGFLANAFFGIIFSIYLLVDKQSLKQQFGNYVKAFSNKKAGIWIFGTLRLSKEVLEDYMLKRIVDVFVSGIIFFILSLIFGFSYPVLLATIIGICCLIPAFGSAIGGIIASVFTLLVDPGKFLFFVLFFIIVNQLIRSFLLPHIIKENATIPAVWVLISVYIGGRLAGFTGMLFAVPVSAVVYRLIKEITLYNKEKNIAKKVKNNIDNDLE